MLIFAKTIIKNRQVIIMYNLYSYRRKRPTRMIIILILITTIVGGSGYIIYRKLKEPIIFKNTAENEIHQESTVNTAPEKKELKYNEHTDFNLTVIYSCGHQADFESKIPLNFIGKTINEIKTENSNYDIYDYSDYKIYAKENLDECCDNHYILILNGNKLTSYNKKTPDITEKEITINPKEFYNEDIKILQNGIEVSSKTELLEYFENFAT